MLKKISIVCLLVAFSSLSLAQSPATQPTSNPSYSSPDCKFEAPAGFRDLKLPPSTNAKAPKAVFINAKDASPTHGPRMVMLSVDPSNLNVTEKNLDELAKGVGMGISKSTENGTFADPVPQQIAGNAGRSLTGSFSKGNIHFKANVLVAVRQGNVFTITLLCDQSEDDLAAMADEVLKSFSWNN